MLTLPVVSSRANLTPFDFVYGHGGIVARDLATLLDVVGPVIGTAISRASRLIVCIIFGLAGRGRFAPQ